MNEGTLSKKILIQTILFILSFWSKNLLAQPFTASAMRGCDSSHLYNTQTRATVFGDSIEGDSRIDPGQFVTARDKWLELRQKVIDEQNAR